MSVHRLSVCITLKIYIRYGPNFHTTHGVLVTRMDQQTDCEDNKEIPFNFIQTSCNYCKDLNVAVFFKQEL